MKFTKADLIKMLTNPNVVVGTPFQLTSHYNLTDGEARIFSMIYTWNAFYYRNENPTEKNYFGFSDTTVADVLNKTRKTINETVKRLEAKGVITITDGGHKRRKLYLSDELLNTLKAFKLAHQNKKEAYFEPQPVKTAYELELEAKLVKAQEQNNTLKQTCQELTELNALNRKQQALNTELKPKLNKNASFYAVMLNNKTANNAMFIQELNDYADIKCSQLGEAVYVKKAIEIKKAVVKRKLTFGGKNIFAYLNASFSNLHQETVNQQQAEIKAQQEQLAQQQAQLNQPTQPAPAVSTPLIKPAVRVEKTPDWLNQPTPAPRNEREYTAEERAKVERMFSLQNQLLNSIGLK